MNTSPATLLGRLPLLLAACAAGMSAAACAGNRQAGGGDQAYYQTAFPTFDTSEALRRAFASVRRFQINATYARYTFAADDAPAATDVAMAELLRAAVDTTTVSQTRAATAVVLSRTDGNIALLTTNHALEFPDTIVQFFEEESGATGADASPTPSRRVESVLIKTNQANWLVGAALDPFEILARDPTRDLALIGVREPPERPDVGLIPGRSLEERILRTPVLTLPAGDSDQLSWGSFVYVLGYPQGYPMVTRGIVSLPTPGARGSFLVDGLWNRGMSGGLIVAVRGDGEGLEWVGIARSAASTVEVQLTPEEGVRPEPGVRRPYRGQLFLQENRRIDYGITLSVPTRDIRPFLDERRAALAQQGFVLPER